MNRVLKAGGKLAISDIIIRGKLNPEWAAEGNSVPPPIACHFCIAGAMTLEGYVRVFEQAGFRKICTEDHSIELKRLAYQLITNRSINFLSDLRANHQSAGNSWQQLFNEARPGYAVIVMAKP